MRAWGRTCGRPRFLERCIRAIQFMGKEVGETLPGGSNRGFMPMVAIGSRSTEFWEEYEGNP